MSKKIYDELVAAGAPELPEGYYYEQWYSGMACTKVAVYQKRERLWDKKRGEVVFFDSQVQGSILMLASFYHMAYERTFPTPTTAREFDGRHP